MKIQYCSDLHLEFRENREYLEENPLPVLGDVLVLAGDILLFRDLEKHGSFLDRMTDQFERVYWVPGNHEYYHSELTDRCGTLNECIRSNLFLVNNVTVVDHGVRFVFSTMWSKINQQNAWYIENAMSDFHVIRYRGRRFETDDFNRLHEESLAFIRQQITVPTDAKTVVVTHHVPTFLNYPPQFKNSPLNGAFAVELHDLIQDSSIDYWIYGHHHGHIPNFNIGKTTLLTNQLGYVKYGEHPEFGEQGWVVEV